MDDVGLKPTNLDSDPGPVPQFKPASSCPHTIECACDPGPVPQDSQVLVDLHAAMILNARALALLLEDSALLGRYLASSAGIAIIELETGARHLSRAIAALEAVR
jgi:hypothetical protein